VVARLARGRELVKVAAAPWKKMQKILEFQLAEEYYDTGPPAAGTCPPQAAAGRFGCCSLGGRPK